jgi:hypothetical protein
LSKVAISGIDEEDFAALVEEFRRALTPAGAW